jgi:hypothetical protein
MAHVTDVRVPSAPSLGDGAHRLFLRLCTSNPFYVLSAGFFLAGLWISFGGQTQTEETWALMAGLAGYTLLLAVTAFGLVRFCKLWDDLRTVLLLVVLMFVAMSVTFDEMLVQAQDSGIAFYVGGFLFAVAVTETLLRGIRLRLPALYRGPYYLLLGLFFLYPLLLTPLVHEERNEARLWAVFGFAPAAALIFLTLLPAVRRGPVYVRDNGSPWPWPLYPWVLFGVLGVAVAGRAWLLCVSMDLLPLGHGGRVIFGPYFLVPLALAIEVLLLEAGIVSRNRRMQTIALLAPIFLILLSVTGLRFDPIFKGFLVIFTERLGADPLYVTLGISAVYYGYAMVRRVRGAAEGLTGALAALAVVSSESLVRGGLFVSPRPEPILAIAFVQLALGLGRRTVWRCLVGAAALIAGWIPFLARGYSSVRQWVTGLDYLAVSLALFGLALGISLTKAGLLTRWRKAPDTTE